MPAPTLSSSSIHAPAPRRPRANSRRVSPENFPPAGPSYSIGFEVCRYCSFYAFYALSFYLSAPQPVSRCTSPVDAPSRLLSPICLDERRTRVHCSVCINPRVFVAPQSLTMLPHTQGPPSPTTSTVAGPRRKRSSHTLRQMNRNRACKAPDCPIARTGPSFFDNLPWVSALQAEPSPELLQPWNIGDLSMLASTRAPRARIGPIRSRKSSLRSAPFPDFAEITPELTPARVGASDSPPTELSLADLCGRRLAFDDVPKTPPSRASRLPIDAGFYNLMPIAFADF